LNLHSINLPQSQINMPVLKTSKEEVIMKSSQIIRQRGYASASMNDLAKACDIQPSHFYYYFKNKEDLMTEILTYSAKYFQERIMIYADDAALNPTEKLEKMLKRSVRLFMFGEGGCIMGNTVLETAHNNPPFLAIIKQFFDDFIHAISKVYQAKYTEEYARDLAEQVVQDIEGGIMLSQLYKDERFMMKAFQRALKHLN
jgi:TetR/AcrR family transcriptional regulator, transcriptional repressor for nem operon